jgi:hypothetical protein
VTTSSSAVRRYSLHALPEATQHTLMREASLYASSRLTEVESRAHYIDDLRQR